jgi:perosamine synthetase
MVDDRHSVHRIPHSKPVLPTREQWSEITARLAPGWIAGGPCVEAFATEAARWLGGSGGVAVNSGTSALHLALLAVGARPGSEVLVPAYCCAALLNAVQFVGGVPVLVDTEPGGANLCPEDARRRQTPRTAAVVVAHLFGQPSPLAPFLDLGIPVIEDCAQSLGAMGEGAPTGSRGAITIGSFYATKVITTGHGGAVSSSCSHYLSIVRDRVEYDNREDWRPRFNYQMTEIQAALGLWQLDRLPSFLARRRAIAGYFDERLALAPVSSVPPSGVCYRYVIRVGEAETVIRELQARGVDAKRPVYRPLHHYLGGDYPGAQTAHEQSVSLPLYPALTDAEVERIVDAVRFVNPRMRRC